MIKYYNNYAHIILMYIIYGNIIDDGLRLNKRHGTYNERERKTEKNLVPIRKKKRTRITHKKNRNLSSIVIPIVMKSISVRQPRKELRNHCV